MDSKHKLILTPNSRLTRHLHAERPSSLDKIIPLQAWLVTCYEQSLFNAAQPLHLLTATQELMIWQDIIKATPATQHLLQLESTAKTAMQAYAMLAHWRCSLDKLSDEQKTDTTTFYQWARNFKAHCAAQHLLSQADLMDWLEQHLPDEPLPKEIILYNFDEFTPQMTYFFTHLKNKACNIVEQQSQRTLHDEAVIACDDLAAELQTMARWAKACHQQNPEEKILCIVPNLNQIRDKLQNTFEEIFLPEKQFNPNIEQRIYNISGGYPLLQAPIIYTALQLLSLNPRQVDYQAFSFLLNTPFLQGYQAEIAERSLFDANLRELDEPELSWKLIFSTLDEYPADFLPQLKAQLIAWQALRQNLSTQQLLIEWKTYFHQLLTRLGWPGERTLSSTEYQQTQRFFELLEELPSVTLEKKDYTYFQALQLLQQQVKNTLFEIQSHDGPIQVLGLLEAAGLTANRCWMMHLDDETWPAAAKPNPLLPYHLQRKLKMPHSSPERELYFSEQLVKRLQKSVGHIIYSVHRHDGDRHLSPSPLLAHLPIITAAQLPLAQSMNIETYLANSSNCVSIIDEQAPAVKLNEKTSGGTGIFKQQAACPFRAFATYRLNARGLVEPELGLDAMQRGSLLHACLDNIWQTLQSQTRLLSINDEDLYAIISEAILNAFQQCLPTYTEKLSTRFKEIEIKRLTNLLYDWLQLEKKRPPFTVVAHEQWQRAQIGPLQVNMQIDRIDQLENGERLVIDYKSGKTDINSWFGARPREPQLPIYCLANLDIAGVAFAQVRSDALCFKGVATDDTAIDGVKTLDKLKDEDIPDTWTSLVQQWHTILQQLANDFFAGNAKVDPAYYDTCNYCELHSLCRIGERE
jgi:probable DNA repair protein